MSFSSEGQIARRPTLFRALGPHEPPGEIRVGGRHYTWLATLKHDSWAATALYEESSGRRIACKFNRAYPVLGLSWAWSGHRVARREARVLQLVDGLNGFPRLARPVHLNDRVLENAVAHDWIPGENFRPGRKVGDHFFPQLSAMVAELHARNIAYVDMAKWENILVGDDGCPYLLDYQAHVCFKPRRPFGWILRSLQAADLYYLHRHWLRTRPDQISESDRASWARQPWIVRAGEWFGTSWRPFRLFILRLCGVSGDPRRRVKQG